MMMHKVAASTILALSLSTAAQAVVITGFGTGDFTADFTDFAVNIQNASSYSVTGSPGSVLFGSVAPVSVGIPAALTLTATEGSDVSNIFIIELFDTDGDSLSYTGSWTSFVTGVESSGVLTFLSSTGSFNGFVATIGLTTGSPGENLAVSLNELAVTAIPEPSSVAALAGFAALGLVAVRRRR